MTDAEPDPARRADRLAMADIRKSVIEAEAIAEEIAKNERHAAAWTSAERDLSSWQAGRPRPDLRVTHAIALAALEAGCDDFGAVNG